MKHNIVTIDHSTQTTLAKTSMLINQIDSIISFLGVVFVVSLVLSLFIIANGEDIDADKKALDKLGSFFDVCMVVSFVLIIILYATKPFIVLNS